MTTSTTMKRDAIIAALRHLASDLQDGKVSSNDGDVGDILTNSGKHAGLTASAIHDLAEHFLEGKGFPAL